MALFSYQAIDRSGRQVRGAMQARDESDLAARLRSMGRFPVEVKRGGEEAPRPKAPARRGSGRRVAAFTHQLASMLEAGIPLDRSLGVFSGLEQDPAFKALLDDLLKGVQGGRPFADCVGSRGEFSPIFVNTVRAGESGGSLDSSLRRMAAYTEDLERLRDEIRSALVYPLLLTAAGGGAVVFMLLFVLPRFSALFDDLGSAIPLPARVMMETGAIVSGYFWVAPLAAALGWVALRRYGLGAEGRARLDRLKLSVPVVGPVLRKASIARFARTLGTLLQAGLPILDALELSVKAAGNLAIEADIRPVLDGVRKGRGLAAPLAATGVMPALAGHMLAVGEETGRLDGMLIKLASDCEHEVKGSIKRALALLEPSIILVMALIVGFMVISILLAVFSLNEMPL